MTLTSTSMTGGAAETASAAGRGAMRPPDPGRDRGTFRDYLNDKVDTHLAGLTAAHAVDEANGDVLDALIDQSVAQQDAAVARELLQEATELRRREQTAASRAEAVASALAACEAEQAAHAGRFRALRQRLLGGPDSPDADASADAPVNPSLQRTFIVQERRHWETAQRAALRSAGLRDTTRLPAAAAARQRKVDTAAEDLAEAQARAPAAENDLADAVAELRRGGQRGTAAIATHGEGVR